MSQQKEQVSHARRAPGLCTCFLSFFSFSVLDANVARGVALTAVTTEQARLRLAEPRHGPAGRADQGTQGCDRAANCVPLTLLPPQSAQFSFSGRVLSGLLSLLGGRGGRRHRPLLPAQRADGPAGHHHSPQGCFPSLAGVPLTRHRTSSCWTRGTTTSRASRPNWAACRTWRTSTCRTTTYPGCPSSWRAWPGSTCCGWRETSSSAPEPSTSAGPFTSSTPPCRPSSAASREQRTCTLFRF